MSLSPAQKCLAKKRKLLALAAAGKPRPIRGKHPLAGCLQNYLAPGSGTYDPGFAAQIAALAPHWPKRRSKERKARLLVMAQRGDPKPQQDRHPLYYALMGYTRNGSGTYDPAFTRQLWQIRPDWLIRTTTANKQRLLELARKNAPRPTGRFRQRCRAYTNPHSECFDAEFTAQIQALVPHWLLRPSAEKKTQILQLARSGQARPHSQLKPLGTALCCYTCPTSETYDKGFTKEVYRLRPDWFRKEPF